MQYGVMYLPLLKHTEGIVLSYDAFNLTFGFLRKERWEDVGMLKALYRTGMALSSEKRGKFYAVIGLAGDGDKIVRRPDYGASVGEVYSSLAVSVIRQSQRLDVLSLAGDSVCPRTRAMQMPTWVPDLIRTLCDELETNKRTSYGKHMGSEFKIEQNC